MSQLTLKADAYTNRDRICRAYILRLWDRCPFTLRALLMRKQFMQTPIRPAMRPIACAMSSNMDAAGLGESDSR